MPRELLGDRAYHAALRRLGVKNPGDVPIGIPIQLQAKVDDLSHLAEPLGLDVWGIGFQMPAIAAPSVNGFAVRATGGGLYWRMHCSELMEIGIQNAGTIPNEALRIAVPFGGNAGTPIAPVPAARIFTGDGAAASWPSLGDGFMWLGNGGVDSVLFQGEMVYLGPGQRLIFRQSTPNDVFDFSFLWREVPSAGG